MSTAYSSAKQQYIGNGVTTEWGFDFPIKKHSELKVYLKRSGMPQVLLEEGVDYSFVTENTIAFPIKTGEAKLQATDVLALQRESVFESEYNFSNQQRLEPEEVMHADDNLERQIQELKRDVSQAIRIQPTSNIDTDEYFVAVESIYENLDNINNVSGISAEIVNCSDNISDISTVSSNIDNVNAVGQSISSVNTVASDISSVNTVAGVSNDVSAVAGIASSVPTVANNDANITTVATNISDVNTAASNIEAIKAAPTAATNAAQSATNAANSETASATSAQAAQNALNEVQGLIATPIGTIFQSVYVDESLDIARRLNGQLISSTKFTGFRSWLNTVQTALPNLFTTETNWQTEKTNSKLGQCGKFVVDDTAGTIRLPAVVNAQGLVDLALIGGIKSESLPNISGAVSFSQGPIYNANNPNSALYGTDINTVNQPAGATPGDKYEHLNLDASRSSSTYQDNAPVQQEAVQYPYYIQVATGVEETLPAIREYKINTPFFFGQSMYSDVAPDNASWLASNGQYNARSVYPDYYDWLVEQMNAGVSGFVASTAAYTDYDFVINTADQTFRLPLKNGEENWVGNETSVLSTADIVKDSPFQWAATKNGFVKFTCYKANTTQVVIARINGQTLIHSGVATNNSTPRPGFWLKVRKGDTISISAETQTLSGVSITFIPAVGNGSLYYYVGDTVQDASLINAGAVLGQLSNKADIDLSNVNNTGNVAASNLNSKGIRTVVETYVNGTNWYRIYSDGWKEQGGFSPNGSYIVTFLKPFTNANYTALCTFQDGYSSNAVSVNSRSKGGLTLNRGTDVTDIGNKAWYACGY